MNLQFEILFIVVFCAILRIKPVKPVSDEGGKAYLEKNADWPKSLSTFSHAPSRN